MAVAITNSKLTGEKPTEPKVDSVKEPTVAKKGKKETKKTDNGGAVTVVLEYRGNGVWKDNKGKRWTNGTTMNMTKDEYLKRKDIRWMVSHNEFKMTEV